MSPEVSIIVAAYNASPFIEKAIRSAQRQTLDSFELIVVDDRSSDDTVEIVSRLGAEDPRIKMHLMPKNGGPGAARSLALKHAIGNWIAILDADDQMQPTRLERLVATAEAHDYDIITDNLNYVNMDSGERFATALPTEPPGAVSSIAVEEFILGNLPGETGFKLGFLKPVIRRSVLVAHGVSYKEDMRVAEDYQFLFELLVAGARLGYLNEPLYDYLVRPQSLSHSYYEDELIKIAETNRAWLDDPQVTRMPDILAAVQKRQIYCDRNAAYVRIIGRLRGREPLALLIMLARTLPYLPYFLWRLVRVLSEGRVWSIHNKPGSA